VKLFLPVRELLLSCVHPRHVVFWGPSFTCPMAVAGSKCSCGQVPGLELFRFIRTAVQNRMLREGKSNLRGERLKDFCERESVDLQVCRRVLLSPRIQASLEPEGRHDTEIAIRSISLVFTQEEFKDRQASQPWNLPYAQGGLGARASSPVLQTSRMRKLSCLPSSSESDPGCDRYPGSTRVPIEDQG